MKGLIDFAAVGGAIVVSLGIALSLEWFALNGLMKLMPARQANSAEGQTKPQLDLVASLRAVRKSRAFGGMQLGRALMPQPVVVAPTSKRAA
jgi:hypothetical protein